ncbi:hypothetical protein FRC12_018440 [Ceratobasidium sp. 428]|nr:hypothetical protein FRC12_018440 [Ceratobasidium sp. 428]
MTSVNKLPTSTLAQALEHLTFRKVIYLSGGYIGLQALLLVYRLTRRRLSPIRNLAGPPNVSFRFGNRKQITSAPFRVLHEERVKKYGHTFVFNDVLESLRLFTADPKALSFIMTQSSSFVRPELVREHFVNNMGPGLLAVEFGTHKRQRRLMVNTYTVSKSYVLTPIKYYH